MNDLWLSFSGTFIALLLGVVVANYATGVAWNDASTTFVTGGMLGWWLGRDT